MPRQNLHDINVRPLLTLALMLAALTATLFLPFGFTSQAASSIVKTDRLSTSIPQTGSRLNAETNFPSSISEAPEFLTQAPAIVNGKIAFVSDRDGNFEIYTMNPDGSNQVRVTFNSWNEFSPTWSPKGTMIAFTGFQFGNISQIYVMNPNGSGQKKLSADSGASDTNPAWSPDESKIAFHRDSGAQSGLYVMNANGNNATRIGSGDYPAWSPDGTKIAFSCVAGGNEAVCLSDADGSNQIVLTDRSTSTHLGFIPTEREPAWSPDGTKIAYTSNRSGNSEIYLMNANGTNQVRLTNNPLSDAANPCWSPDGTKIAFRDSVIGDIIAMNADGSGLQNISNRNGSADTQPSWQLRLVSSPPIPPTSSLTLLSMSGEQGDYIGGPNNYYYNATDGTFGASANDNTGDGTVDSVSLSFMSSDHWWYLDFNTSRMLGKNLEPGFYDDAQRAPFASTGHPGLSISGDGRGCNQLTGNFTVHEAVFDYSGASPKVVSFTASFEQHCEGGPAALLGTIYYNYTGSAVTYDIGGLVVDTSGNPVSGLPIVLSGSNTLTTNTDPSGKYTFENLLPGGNFRVIPKVSPNYVFSPQTQTLKRLSADQGAINFTAVPLYSISGKVTDNNGSAMTGVQVTLAGTKAATAFTDNSGNYSFTDLRSDGNYTVTPSRQFFGFAPENRTFNTLNGNQTVNFTGTRLSFAIGGRVINEFGTGIGGITINLSGTQSATMQTDSMGNYSFANLPAGGNYGITAIRPNYTFTPPSQSIFGLNSNFNSVNFTGRLVNYIISGVVLDGSGNAITNVILTLSGSKTGATTANLNGAYSFTVPAEGNYTITPSKSNYVFAPASRTFNNLSGNQPANFIGSPLPQLILDLSGPDPNQAAAIDSILFLRDPFPVINAANLLNQGTDKNTRVIIFVTNLQLAQGESPSAVIVNLVGSNNQPYEIGAEDVRFISSFNFTQVTFRLPDSLASGTCLVKVRAHGLESNAGTMRIAN